MSDAVILQENGDKIVKPSDGDVSSALQNLSIVNKNTSLIVHHGNKDNYLRINGDLYHGFSAEYRTENEDIPQETIDKNINFDITLRLAQKYVKNEADWKDLVAWNEKKAKNPLLSMKSIPKIALSSEALIILLLLVILGVFVFFIGSNNPFSRH